MRRARGKRASLDRAVEIVSAWRAGGERVVLSNGVFDLLHVGHTRYLTAARSLGTRLVVGVNADGAAAALKGPGRPVLGHDDRALVIAALAVVDLVVVFDEPTADRLIEALRPHVHAKGTDYRPDTVPERDTVAGVGGTTAVAGDAKAHASRELVERVRARYGTA